MKTAVACGGTGGHIFPGLATAEILREQGHEVVLWLAGKDVETPAVKDWNGPVVTVAAEGLPSGFSLRTIRALWRTSRAMVTCRRLMKDNKPDVLLAMGSYASVGPVSAALRLDVPVVLHEANVIPGRAVRLFARRAAAVAASFEETRYHLKRGGIIVTGMPLRRDLELKAKAGRPGGKERFTILVTGGSRGAHRLNEIVSEAIAILHKQGHELGVVHLTGVADEEFVRATYARAGARAEVHAFAADMASIYSRVDLAICRSGAATCAELAAFALPALLVPYPFAASDHQTANARALEKADAADVVPERDLTVGWLLDYIVGCMRNPARLSRMSASMSENVRHNGAAALAELVMRVGGGRDGGRQQV